ncbi:unnamed protein product [Symbiodinium sp. CCMP2592]|nr:unnamed protein product [Symbiodinium sp. CCMP2592]
MADRFVQKDFLWLLSFKGGTDCERGQLLGQDLIKDLEECKGIRQELWTHSKSMKTVKMTKVFRSFIDEISEMSKSISEEQRELQEICRKMRWPSGTTKIAENLGHAILEEDILPRFREYLQDSRSQPIQKHQVICSDRYLRLLEKLMAERLTGERQPKLSRPTKVELPSNGFLSPEERANILKDPGLGLALPTLEEKQANKKHKRAEAEKVNNMLSDIPQKIPQQFDEVSLFSLTTRKTKTTGILAKHTFKVNLVKLPSPMQKDYAEVDDDESVSSQSAIFDLVAKRLQETSEIEISGEALRDLFSESAFDLVAQRLKETFEIEITGEALRDLVSEIQHHVSGIGYLSDFSHEGPEDGAVPDVKDLIQELGKANIDIGDKHKFEAYWASAVDAFEEMVVTKYLRAEAKTLQPGDEIPL